MKVRKQTKGRHAQVYIWYSYAKQLIRMRPVKRACYEDALRGDIGLKAPKPGTFRKYLLLSKLIGDSDAHECCAHIHNHLEANDKRVSIPRFIAEYTAAVTEFDLLGFCHRIKAEHL